MPYRVWVSDEDYVLIPRVSDIVSTYICEYTAYANPINKQKRGLKAEPKYSSNIYAFRGTLVHHRIENEIRKELGLPTEELDLTFGEKRLYEHILTDEALASDMIKHIDICMENYAGFRDEFNIIPISSEENVVCLKKREDGTIDIERSLKGTIDLVAEIETENGWETAIIDWKSSKQQRKSVKIQLTGYYYLLTECGVWERLTNEGRIRHPYSVSAFEGGKYDVPRAMCVCLGNAEKGHIAKWYSVEDTEFFRMWKIFNCPKASLQSYESVNNRGMKGMMCAMCSYRPECPMFYQWSDEND